MPCVCIGGDDLTVVINALCIGGDDLTVNQRRAEQPRRNRLRHVIGGPLAVRSRSVVCYPVYHVIPHRLGVTVQARNSPNYA